MKIDGKTARIALLVIFTALFFWGLSSSAHAKHEAVVGLGIGIIHLDDSYKTQTVGYRYNRAWSIELTRTGRAYTRDDDLHDENWRIAATRYVHWREGKLIEPWLRFGVNVWDEKPAALVDDNLCFDLGLGVSINRVAEIGWLHCSTAGRTEPNNGIDEIQLRFNMRF